MKDLIFILGKDANISLSELCSIYGEEKINLINSHAAIGKNIPIEELAIDQLGGIIKIGIINEFVNEKNSLHKLANDLSDLIRQINIDKTKIRIGISFYNTEIDVKKINLLGQFIKNIFKGTIRISFVQNKSINLNAASVINNKLINKSGLEILIIKDKDQFIIANTIQVQNIDLYTKRDYFRPYRDNKIGMLPPKLAQIIINLALPQQKNINNLTLLDPFCGTGVILQEALLRKINVQGTDINPRMIEYAKDNLKWLKNKFKIDQELEIILSVQDATRAKWTKFDLIATECYLGKPFSKAPSKDELTILKAELKLLITSFLKNLFPQCQPKARLCIAIPIWRLNNSQLEYLDIVDQIEKLGYNLISFKSLNSQDLIYIRSNQIVGRQLLILEKE